MNRVEELKQAIKSSRCILVLGSGVTASLSGNAPVSSWKGLILDGIKFASKTGATSDVDWESSISAKLESAINAQDLLQVGEDLVARFSENGGGEFKRWMRESIGSLTPQDQSVAHALDQLGLPMVTTNYDDLVESCTNRHPITWLDTSSVQMALSMQSRDVVHLHGHWSEDASVILTNSQYELMLADRKMVSIRQAMASVNSLIYVGFGEGLSDPTFKQLRDWIKTQFPDQELHHYRLCLKHELDEMAAEYRGETIKPVPYGSSYSELPIFLHGLTPKGSSIGIVTSHSELGLRNVQKLIQDTALVSSYIGIENASVEQLLIPPVLLPVPHEQFVRNPKDVVDKIERCDLSIEVQNTRLLIVGEENVGVTSALLWMINAVAKVYKESIPLVIDYNRIGAGKEPLHRRIRQELRALGVDIGPHDTLPKVNLIIDNLNLAKKEKWSRVAEELLDSNIVWVALGCHKGSEIDVLQTLSEDERERFRTLYVGRLKKSDVRTLAKLLHSRRSDELTERSVELVRSQHLPSTPFTFSMILGALLRGETLLAATSTTTLLDAYVEALLGRGSLDDDSRSGMDSFGRNSLLSELAKIFVERKLGEIHQDEIVKALRELFDLYDWDENPVEILKDFQSRKILLLKGTYVSFTQTSYLHLFAAKYAVKEPNFLDKLKEDPLYYAPIISHYASLKRNDQALLKELAPLVKPFLAEQIVPATAWRSSSLEIDPSDTPEEEVSDPLEQISSEVDRLPERDQEIEPLDGVEEVDIVPFPLQPIEDLPPIPRMYIALGLISNLLRDTEIITDQELRKDVLKDVLLGWAQIADRIETEVNFETVSEVVAGRLAEELQIPKKLRDNFIDEVVTMLPLAFAMSGISSSLSSQKLVRAILRGLTEGTLKEDVRTAVLGMYVLLDVGAEGWSTPLKELLENYANIPAVRLTVRRQVLMKYMKRELSPNDEKNTQEFLVDQLLRERYGTSRERSEKRGLVIEKLKSIRLKRRKFLERTSSDPDE